MNEMQDLLASIPSVWADLTTLKRAVVVVKAIADFSYCGLPPLLFRKDAMTLQTLTLLPVAALCYLTSDAAMYFSISKSADSTQSWIALALISYGLIFFAWAQYTLSRTPGLTAAFSSDEPQFLIRTGPWALVRNPCYSSYLSSLLAGFILTSSSNHPDHDHSFLVSHAGGITFACFAVALTIFYQAIRQEEAKFSASKLRGQYEEYKKRVWALLPLADVFGRR